MMLAPYQAEFQLGVSRVFMRESLERKLEKERSEILNKAAVTVQCAMRGMEQIIR